MKRLFLKISSVLLGTVMLAAAVTAVPCAAENKQSQVTEITVRKSEILRKGAFKAIQVALNTARYSATKDNIYKVIVEPGSYDLRSALHVYSNTTLSLYNVTFVRNKEAMANMIRAGEDTSVTKGETGYSANANITVMGGTLDGNGTSNTILKVTHASNFSMIGTEVCNTKNAHMIEAAAVDGFQIRNCTFKDQRLDVGGVGYEAIQLDIPKDGHIIGCRSEALNMRNVTVEGCFFSNCPRGVGTHTQIMNLPMEHISIINNTFTDIKSVAIQGENWKDVKISNNRIEKTPRAIAIYSVLGKAECGFLAGTLAKEGNTDTDVSDSYQTPYEANIRITDNVITDCGGVKDVYAKYDPLAISVMGKNLTSAVKQRSDGSGGYPKGNYYIDGVTVKGNSVSTAGHGIYLENVRNANVTANRLSSTKNKITNKTACPLTALSVTFSSISGNTITASSFHGMELAKSTVENITGNTISGAAQDGIILEAVSSVTEKIASNVIAKSSRYGINVRPKCAAGRVSGNIIYDFGKGGIRQENTATIDMGTNYFEVAQMESLSLDTQSVTLGTNETYKLKPSFSPVNVLSQLSWSSSDPQVATVSADGVVTARGYGEADVTATSSNKKTASCHFKVMPAARSVKLNANMLTIGLGETFDLDSRLPEGTVSYSITYSSNNTSAVTVDAENGMIKGVGIGTATVVCKTYNGKHAACNVIVRDAPYDIWFDNRELCLGEGESTALHVELPDGSASRSMVWKSDNEAVVKVGENGVLTAQSVGEATVTATAFNGATAICHVTVQHQPQVLRFSEPVYTIDIGETLQPEIILAEGTASHSLQFQSSDPDICHVDRATGEITAKRPGIVTITVKTYNRVYTTCTVVVNAVTPVE